MAPRKTTAKRKRKEDVNLKSKSNEINDSRNNKKGKTLEIVDVASSEDELEDVGKDVVCETPILQSTRRVTRSTSKTPSKVATKTTVSKKVPVKDDDLYELLSIDGSASSSESNSDDDSDFEVPTSGNKARNTFKAKIKAESSNQVKLRKKNLKCDETSVSIKKKAKPVKVKLRSTKSKNNAGPVLSSSEDSDSDGELEEVSATKRFVTTKNRPGADFLIHQSVPKKTKKLVLQLNTNVGRLEDSSEEEDSASKSFSVTSSANKHHGLSPIKDIASSDSQANLTPNNNVEKSAKSVDVRKLLEIGENIGRRKSTNVSDDSNSTNNFDKDSDDSSVDWEEVDDGNATGNHGSPHKPSSIPAEGVVITLPNEGGLHRRKGKKKFDIQDWIRKDLNRKMKDIQADMHKASLVCCVARGLMMNNWLRSDELIGIALSVLPIEQTHRPKRLDVVSFSKFLTWFRTTYRVLTDSNEDEGEFVESLKIQIVSKKPTTYKNQLFIFITFLRSIGIDVRLMWSLQPLPLKLSSDELIKRPKTKDEDDSQGEDQERSDKKSPEKTKAKKKGKSVTKKKAPSSSSKKSGSTKNDNLGRKIVSSSEEETVKTEKPKIEREGRDFWAEVYLKDEKRWVSVDLSSGKMLEDSKIEAAATQPVYYVLGFDNAGHLKDVTRRYASRWLTHTQKQRVDSEWWDETLNPFLGPRSVKDKAEDAFLDRELMKQPIPKTVGELKGHPLYALRRHLLKFEAIYPPEPAPLEFIKSEPIFSRDCVKTLHTRELWSRKAKVVRIGETPYKIVKARPKYDRFSQSMISDQPLELFGEWQVEDYVPPVAKDGKVPRNEYGNVELFLDKMLPKGTVHLNLPGLNRVAKKLDIDCAPALTGFEYHRGGCHPSFEGYIVCEEFQEILLDAWNQEQDEQKKREEEKRRNRVYGNWRRLIRGVMIREKLQKKYSHTLSSKRKHEDNEPSTSKAASKKRAKK